MTDDRPAPDTRALGGTVDDPLPISKAEIIAEFEAMKGTGCGSYATEAPSGPAGTDWPRDYACSD